VTPFFLHYKENQQDGTTKQILQVANVTRQQPTINSYDSCLGWDLLMEIRGNIAQHITYIACRSCGLCPRFTPAMQGSGI